MTSSEDAESLPEPDVPAREIADDLQAAMEPFQANSEWAQYSRMRSSSGALHCKIRSFRR
jgi:hypothetical protein